MPDLNRDIDSPSRLERKTSQFLARLRETGHPVVLTINGEAELIVQDPASYQRLIELAERAERMQIVGASVEEMKAGQGIPAEDVLAEMRRILSEKQAR
jgi:PHD/YefM family antitoxin component YafN of YafNO toxin-antitoxin module